MNAYYKSINSYSGAPPRVRPSQSQAELRAASQQDPQHQRVQQPPSFRPPAGKQPQKPAPGPAVSQPLALLSASKRPRNPMRRVNTVPRADPYRMAYDQQLYEIGGGGRGQGHRKRNVYSEDDDWYNDGPRSKVGSLDNIDHMPKASTVKIESRKINWARRAAAKIGSLDNFYHNPGGGEGRVFEQPTNWHAESKVGSLDNIEHLPGGGTKKIETRRVNWQTQSKVGSLDNIDHKPQASVLPIMDKKLSWNARSKVGSLDNYYHEPQGGKGQIFSEKLEWGTEPRIDAKNPEFERKKNDRRQQQEQEQARQRPVVTVTGRYQHILPPIGRRAKDGPAAAATAWTRGPNQERLDRFER